MRFFEQATELVSSVFGPVLPAHGFSGKTLAAAERRLGHTLPVVLHDYYALIGKHRQVSAGMNRLLRPSALYVDDERLVFAEENQGCFVAGIPLKDRHGDDPPVQERYHGKRGWHLACARLSQYLLVTFCWQACNTLPAVAQSKVTRLKLAILKSGLRWTSLGAAPEADTIGFWGDGVAAVVFAGSGNLYVATRTDAQLGAFGRKWGLELSVC